MPTSAKARRASGELLALVSSANIACGFHAGDPGSMTASILAAQRGRRGGRGASEPGRPGEFWAARTAGHAERSLCPRRLPGRRVSGHRQFVRRASEPHQTARRALQHGGARSGAGRGGRAVPCWRWIVRCSSSRRRKRARARRRSDRAADRPGGFCRSKLSCPTARSSRAPARTRSSTTRTKRPIGSCACCREKVVRAVDGSDVALEVDTICLHGDKPEAVDFARKLRARLSARRSKGGGAFELTDGYA